ncbi:hypothetical protein BC831DRAFT_383650, partial [Entophlyctis helioformis]
CPKAYTRKYNLEAHMRGHYNLKPFKCTAPGCTEAFVRKHDLQRHVVCLHSRVAYGPCDYCGRTYSRGDTYRKH